MPIRFCRIFLALVLAFAATAAHADDLDVIVNGNTTTEERGEAYYRLTTADFSTIAPKLIKLVSTHCSLSGLGPKTKEPWKETSFTENDRISFTLWQLWDVQKSTKTRGELYRILLPLLDDPSDADDRIKNRVEEEIFRCLYFVGEPKNPSLPPMENILQVFERMVRERKKPNAWRFDNKLSYQMLDFLFQHGKPDDYLNLAFETLSTEATPALRAEAFCLYIPVKLSGKLSAENRRKYVALGFRLLQMIDDGKSPLDYSLSYSVAVHIGDFTGNSFPPPDPKAPQYNGPYGQKRLSRVTVSNARKWWEDHRTQY